MDRRTFCRLALGTALVGSCDALARPLFAAELSAPDFFFRNGDRVVMIGDSITEQHLHSNYVESYVLSRFPQWQLHFRNVGIGGDTSTGGNNRTVRDVLSFSPTAVTITFGMNDGGYRQPHDPARLEAYRKGLQGMLDQLKSINARVAVLSSSPVEKKEEGPALEGYNQTLELFASNAREIAQQGGARFVDQFHPHVETLQRARSVDGTKRINGGDAVHPGPPGQLLMAWAILKGLGAPRLVSAATVDARRKRVEDPQNCAVRDLKVGKDSVQFVREDGALPWWIAPEERPILEWAPVVSDLDQYLLTVRNLPDGQYDLKIDGEACGTFVDSDLAGGVNLALMSEGPIARQAKAVQDAVFAKNRYYHDQIFRGVVLNNQVPDSEKPGQIDQRIKGMAPLEQAIRDALVLKPHQVELTKRS